MTKTQLKTAKEKYFELSKLISSTTGDKLVKETTEQQEARIKHLLKPQNYVEFFDFYFGVNSGNPLADAPSAKFHQSSYEKVFADRFIIQMRQWFRGAAKSIHTNVGNILHLKENDELNFAVLIGRNGNLANILLSDLQLHLESNQLFIKDFGQQISYGNWSDGEFETLDGKHFKALGLNQPFRGLRFGADRPDFASVDDCEDRDQAKNQQMVSKYGDKIVSDLMKAFHLRRGRLVIPNNYIVKNGLLDYIQNRFKDSPNFHLSRVNLRKDDGTPSWDERMTLEDVDKIDAKTPYFTSQREDYNNPIEEGKLFKADQIIKRKVHGNEKWDGFLIHWDLSYTSQGDYKAGVMLGIQKNELTILDVFCQRAGIPSAMEKHFEWIFQLKMKGHSALSFYDATAAQQAVYAPVILQCAEENNATDIPMPMHQQGDKHNRIEATITNALHRGILFWRDSLEGKDYDAFMDQVLSFEKGTTANDDAPDTLECAVRLAQMYFGYSQNQGNGKPLFGKPKKRKI